MPEANSFLSSFLSFFLNRMACCCYQEIAAILISFQRHAEWQSREVKVRPRSGSMLLYSRKKVRYRRDGYCWKKRKDGKTTREDHMKLKVVFHFHGRKKKKRMGERWKERCLQRAFVFGYRCRESSASTAVTCTRRSFRRFIGDVIGCYRIQTSSSFTT